MADDDFDNDFSNTNDITEDNDDDVAELNIDEEDTEEDNKFKLITYKNILEGIEKKNKKTYPILTKFEKARIIGVRLQQLANGARPLVDTSNLKTINEIVHLELEKRMIPFIIRRLLPNGHYEDWKLEEFISIN
jgi:DNA-directed RNA polymerase I, II, and III subunit RPABC2